MGMVGAYLNGDEEEGAHNMPSGANAVPFTIKDGEFGMAMGGERMTWVINDQPFDHARVDAAPRLGETEIWRFTNRSGPHAHPMHIHLDMFQILDRNGAPPTPAE